MAICSTFAQDQGISNPSVHRGVTHEVPLLSKEILVPKKCYVMRATFLCGYSSWEVTQAPMGVLITMHKLETLSGLNNFFFKGKHKFGREMGSMGDRHIIGEDRMVVRFDQTTLYVCIKFSNNKNLKHTKKRQFIENSLKYIQ